MAAASGTADVGQLFGLPDRSWTGAVRDARPRVATQADRPDHPESRAAAPAPLTEGSLLALLAESRRESRIENRVRILVWAAAWIGLLLAAI